MLFRSALLVWVAFLSFGGVRAASAQDVHLLVVTGVGGDDEHSTQFQKWAGAVVDSAKKHGVLEGNVNWLGEAPDKDPRIKARSSKENVTKAFTDLAGRAKPNDDIFIMLIGHGSFDGKTGAFNLPGPDLSADDCCASSSRRRWSS